MKAVYHDEPCFGLIEAAFATPMGERWMQDIKVIRNDQVHHYVIDLGISYKEDPDRVVRLLREVGETLREDDKYGPLILDAIGVMGVANFADWWVTIKLRIKTLPTKQWEVGRELRRRILRAFDEHGIEIPSPAMKPAGVAGPERPGLRANNPTDPKPPASDPGIPGRS